MGLIDKILKEATKTITITAKDEENTLVDLLNAIKDIGNVGHSFDILVDPKPDWDKNPNHGEGDTFNWDGDGSDRIEKISVETMKEGWDKRKYLSWKRKNVTLRGVRDRYADDNGGSAMLGQGLYTAFLSNKQMAKLYGEVYFLLNAIPKKPLVVNTLNDWEIWEQRNLYKDYNYDQRKFTAAGKTVRDEMIKLGYDGVIIKGREMVNYNPPDNIKYFQNENQLLQYYKDFVEENLTEDITLDIDKGDTILTGRFKNHKVEVDKIGEDEHGMPTVNGKQITKIRIPKIEESLVEEIIEESRLKLNELGDFNNISPFPFRKNGNYYASIVEETATTPFLNIQLSITRQPLYYVQNSLPQVAKIIEEKGGTLETVGFSVNNDEGQAFKTNIRVYLSILSTVVAMIKDYIATAKPDILMFSGSNKDGGAGNNDNTKSMMYKNIVRNNITNNTIYGFCETEFLGIKVSCLYNKRKYTEAQIRAKKEYSLTKELVEANDYTRIDSYYKKFDQNLYGFIIRDMTTFRTPESKLKAVARIEKARKSISSLPTIEIEPSMLMAVQGKQDETPFAVKLNRVYYLLGGKDKVREMVLNNVKTIKIHCLEL
jgi:hypothetical protein